MGGGKWQFKSKEALETIKRFGATFAIAGLVAITQELAHSDSIWAGLAVALGNALVTGLREWAKDNAQ